MEQLTIDRAKWLRGDPGSGCMLDSTTGGMCCLGFVGAKLGIPD